MKKVLVENEKGKMDFDYVLSKTKKRGKLERTLVTSMEPQWSDHYRNYRVMTLTDDGDGLEILMHAEDKKIELNYIEAHELLIMLTKHNDIKFKIK